MILCHFQYKIYILGYSSAIRLKLGIGTDEDKSPRNGFKKERKYMLMLQLEFD